MRLLARILLNAVALMVAQWFVPGVHVAAPITALAAGAILGVINALVRPVLLVLTFPLTLVTLGLFIFVVNAICFGLTAALVPGFELNGYWAAFLGALVMTVVSWILNGLILDPIGQRDARQGRQR